MISSSNEALSQFIKQLSSNYDMQAPQEAPIAIFPSMVLGISPNTCSIPSLSLLSPSNHERPHFDVSRKLDQSHHQHFIHLMSRSIKYRQHSFPLLSFSLLRNLVLTFGSILEYHLQRMICNVMKTKKSSKSEMDQEVFSKFANLPTNINGTSLVVPELIMTEFSTILPMDHWYEMSRGYTSSQLTFKAEITVRVLSNNEIHTAFIKAPGKVLGIYTNTTNMKHPDSIEIDIDTEILYNSIRKECKKISKKVVNAIAGYDINKYQKKKKPKYRDLLPTPDVLRSDGSTSKTEPTAISSFDGLDFISNSLLNDDDLSNVPSSLSQKDIDNTPKKKNKSTYCNHNDFYSETGKDIVNDSCSPDAGVTTSLLKIPIVTKSQRAKDSSKEGKYSIWKRILSPQKKVTNGL